MSIRKIYGRPITCALLLVMGLGACTAQQAQTTLNASKVDLQEALTLYGVAKGIAQVAANADPKVALVVLPALAVLDPLAAKAQAALNDAEADAPAVEALAVQIKGQVDALTVASAPAIKVVPASP